MVRYECIDGRGRWRAVGLVFVAGLVVVLALTQVVDVLRPNRAVGQWKSAGAAREYDRAYTEAMAAIPGPDEVRDVVTSFGVVRVMRWQGSADGPPVLLLPGRSSGAPMWVENLPSWIGRRTVYTVDAIGDAGHSAQSVPLTSTADQATWLAETVRALGEEPVHVVGHSFGGAMAAEFALAHPDLVATLTLLEPIMVIAGMPASIYPWATVLTVPAPQWLRDRALARIGGTSVEEVRRRTPMSELIDAASEGYAAALPMPSTLTDEQWRSLAMPLRVDLGAESDLAGGAKGAERLRSLIPSAAVTLWPGAAHSLPMERHEQLGDELLQFWDRPR